MARRHEAAARELVPLGADGCERRAAGAAERGLVRALDAADDVGRDRRACIGVGLDALDLAVQRDHGAPLVDAAEAHERHREDAAVERGVGSRHVEQQLAAGEVAGLAAGQPARHVQEVGPAVGGQREGDAVGVTGGAGTPDDAAAAEVDLVAADAEEGRHGRREAPAGAYAGPCVATGSHRLDAAQQGERPADLLAVELVEAHAHETGIGAVAEVRRGLEAQDADAVVVVAPPRVERRRARRRRARCACRRRAAARRGAATSLRAARRGSRPTAPRGPSRGSS